MGPRHRPTLHDFTWSGIKANLAANIKLGLDLKGGSHLVMRVKTDEVFKNLTLNDASAIETIAREGGYPVKGVKAETSGGNYRIVLESFIGTNIQHRRGSKSFARRYGFQQPSRITLCRTE